MAPWVPQARHRMKTAALTCLIVLIVALTPPELVQAAPGKKSTESKPLRVTVHPRKRRGGYSYSRTDSISAKEMRRFIDPPRQSLGGPFDKGFFFEQPSSPYGGSSPYMH